MISPYQSQQLISLDATSDERANLLSYAEQLKQVPISSRELGDLLMLGMGAFTPLTGFMTYDDWQSVCQDMITSDGIVWPIPITLSATQETADAIEKNEQVALTYEGHVYGILEVSEKYQIDKHFECQQVFQTTDEAHPGVTMVMQQGEVNLAGKVTVLSQDGYREKFGELYLTPQQTREQFEKLNWQTIAAFQTRNPMHRAHEHLVQTALEICDGVLIHSLLGQVRSEDVPAKVRVQAINALVTNYFREGTVLQAGYPLDMRYAGPREAVLHAIFRQNFGCTHIIIGRDHAGLRDYYGPYDAQEIFKQLPVDALQIEILTLDWCFWCNKCDGMVNEKSCPHTKDDWDLISGSRLREELSNGDHIPPHFSRPEVLEILRAYYHQKKQD